MPAPLRLASHGAADLARELAGLARRQLFGQGRRRHVQGGELLDEEGDPLRLGLLVDPVQGWDAVLLAELGDPLVGQDHQVLDQPVGLRLGD